MTSIVWLAQRAPSSTVFADSDEVVHTESVEAAMSNWERDANGVLVADPRGLGVSRDVFAALTQHIAADSLVVVAGSETDDVARSAAEFGAHNILLDHELTRRHVQRAVGFAATYALRHAAAQLEQLEQLAHLDPLTEVLNRRGLERALTEEQARARRSGEHVGAILIDGDDFKSVNDTFGHDRGDTVLHEIAERLRTTIRPSDRIGRLGGDEFLVLLPDTRHAEALEVAERLRRTIAHTPVALPADDVVTTVSLAVVPVAHDDAIGEILQRAHEALATCKTSGKNTVVGTGRVEDIAGVQLPPSHELCDAAGFSVVRHPIVRLADGEIVGHELLSRGPTGLLESPRDLFRYCREKRILPDVDIACLRSCLSALDAWTPPGRVHVNVFPHTLASLDVSILLDVLAPTAREHDLIIELSEQQFAGDMTRFAEKIDALREAGIDIAIDDVGFGRSSLEAFVMLEPRVLKICPGYVHGCAETVARQRALERIVRLAEAGECTLIAEGVESQRDLECVRRLGIGEAQGYLWGEPVPC